MLKHKLTEFFSNQQISITEQQIQLLVNLINNKNINSTTVSVTKEETDYLFELLTQETIEHD